MSEVCAVESCGGKPPFGQLCEKHYRRMRRHGSFDHPQRWRDQTEAERFWTKVAISEADTCWLWTGGDINSKGYGRFRTYHKSKTRRCLAHRYAYEDARGPLGQEMLVLHTCDTPLCCNPAHLRAGTQLDNMRDALAKGRMNLSGLDLGIPFRFGALR